jgi:hypothetical protein
MVLNYYEINTRAINLLTSVKKQVLSIDVQLKFCLSFGFLK